MKNWKRVLSVLLAVVLVGTMVSGLALADEKKAVEWKIKSIKVKEDYKKQEIQVGDDDLYLGGNKLEVEYEEEPKYDKETQYLKREELKWASSPEGVGYVSYYGAFTAQKEGTATVTVSNQAGTIKDTITLTVKDVKPVTKVSFSTTSFEIGVGEDLNLWKFVKFEPEGSGYDELDTISSDPEVVEAGYMYAEGVKAGTATVTVTATNKDGSTAVGSVNITVTEKALKSLKFSKSSVTIKKLEKESLYLGNYLTVEPANADIVNLKWESSNEKVAGIGDGWVYARRPGTATITVKSKENPSIKAEIEVKVVENNVAIDQLKFDEKSVTLYFIKKDGKSDDDRSYKQVSFDVQPSEAEGTIKNVAWTTSDANVAIAHSEGKTSTYARIQAVGKGKCTITARVTDTSGNTYTASLKVKVKEKSPTAKLNKTEITLRAGKKKTLKATDADSKVKLEGKWSSSDKSVAKVNKKTGKVTAVGEGRAIITFKPTNKAYKSVTCVVNVKPAD